MKNLKTLEEISKLEFLLINDILPYWEKNGIDFNKGGFFEFLKNSDKGFGEIRRTRLIARQIYSFSEGYALGWKGPIEKIIQHGLDFIIQNKMISSTGRLAKSINLKNSEVNFSHDLYDYAFFLFCLAEISTRTKFKTFAEEYAKKTLKYLELNWRHPKIGFIEDPHNSFFLKSNPHMHMLEACLHWEIKGDSQVYQFREIADEIVELAISKFIDQDKGFLYELFNEDWSIPDKKEFLIIEPGHQFEWGYLLLQWSLLRDNYKVYKYAKNLINIGEEFGISRTNRSVVNSINKNLSYEDANCKICPQTERVKVWSLIVSNHKKFNFGLQESSYSLAKSISNLNIFLKKKDNNALWEEILDLNGNFIDIPNKASSLYHIVFAISNLNKIKSSF